MATRDPRGDGTGAVTTGGGTEPMARPAAVHPNASSHTRPDVPPMLGKLAAWSWRLLVVLTAAGLLLYLLIQLKVIVVPVIVALFLATLLVPLVRWLEGRGWKHLPAVLAVFLGAVLLLAAIIAGFIPLIGNELDTLRQRADEGVAEVQRYIASRPFGLSEADLNRYLDQARERFTENSSGLTRGAVEGVTLVGEVHHRADPVPVPDLLLRQGLRALHPLDPRLRRPAPRRPTCARSAPARPPRSPATCAARRRSGRSTPSSSASGWPSSASPWSSPWPS